MALTLADGRTKFVLLTTEPADPNAPTTTELAAGIEAADFINKPDFRFGPSDSDTVPDQPLSQKGNATTWGNGNFEWRMTVLRDLDPTTGQPAAAGDLVWEALAVKGTTVWGYLRKGPLEAVDFAAADEVLWCKGVTDDPQEPQDMAGYVKNPVPMGPQDWGRGVVAAGA